jgi:uncharacterized protein with HEPN domain
MPSTPSKSPAAALRDILDNIELARSFVAGLSFDRFQADRRTVYAVVRCSEIISEASRRLPAELKARHPEMPWTDMAGAGSIYRHHYQDVRDTYVWHTIEQSLEPLRIVVVTELERLTNK